ncbi:helix-turn-helix domain-containing protein [Xanthobacter sp. 126]|uniref:GlxA family transcriptional regulator n=1 Tax=Xanthobacter sp. 126 TaxID=1131814 RepID=UPI0004B25F32|nr:helix-turn-helix domain-containing protein [Xanthobacter sp. 126]
MQQRHVVFVVFPDALVLDLSGPLAAFELSCETSEGAAPPYSLTVASVAGGLVRMSSGLELMSQPLPGVGEVDTLVVVGGPGVHMAAREPHLLAWISDRAGGIRRVCSVCTGAFVLAAAGLLGGRRVVTHWGSCRLLLALQAADDGGFEALHSWISDHLDQDLRVETLAERVSMSPRTFARLYAARTGRTPAKVVEELRLDAARRALEETRQSIKEIAVRCGFADEERMRRAFRRRLGVNPQDYRGKFGSIEAGGVAR